MKKIDTDTEYIHRVLNGDTAAFRPLVEQYQTMVFTLAFKIVGSREEAEDVAQEVFVKCYRSLRSYNFQSRFSTWLYKITYNHSIDTLKKHGSRSRVFELKDNVSHSPHISATAGDGLDAKKLQKLMNDIIGQLPDDEKIIVILYYYDDQPLKEIAGILGIKENNVKIRLHRIRSKLMEQLKSQRELISTLIS